MYVVTGATGNTGSVVAEKLLAVGKKVRVIGRSVEKLASLVALGAEPVAADLTDKDAIAKAFEGAEAAYVMVPPNLGSADLLAYDDAVIEALGFALERNSVRHAVVLSSIGADKESKTGPIVAPHRLEERLKRIAGLNASYLRAGYFMENTLAQAGVIQQLGMTAGPLTPELRIPMIATRDIGAFAGDALLRLDFEGHHTQELLGPRDLTMVEVTSMIGKGIGKEGLRYQEIGYDMFRGALLQMGISENVGDLFVEMSKALNSGHVRALEPRTPRNTTPTPYETFVADTFVPAFKGKQAAA